MDLRELRFRARLTQYDVAKMTGIAQPKISLIERGYTKMRQDEEKKLRQIFTGDQNGN